MRTFYTVILLLAAASIGSSQDWPKPSDRWKLLPDFWGTLNPTTKPSAKPAPVVQPVILGQLQTGRAQTTTPQCSVPLLRAEIPNDVNYTIVEVPKSSERMVPMPKVILPAPPCE